LARLFGWRKLRQETQKPGQKTSDLVVSGLAQHPVFLKSTGDWQPKGNPD